ncbi:uncharacterized protein LOC104885042 [Beta vulgaris subsp. vulgaris]|uniref:uncharacterized protein LOC104885042 n=1 Tax=Beta vulgaris subsp. vulgaris TaxID=3555 RepID=UPI002036C78C|nr:uncharacterized protein LOC104885042 [Beta vulgaris subsp. vulgaris]
MNCGWRLHAGRLPDGITWAIKSIQNAEHNCVRLETNNPMVNVKWAARVLMEDIRANNDVPAKALNQLLFSRDLGSKWHRVLCTELENMLCWRYMGVMMCPIAIPTYCEVLKNLNPGSVANYAWNLPSHPERPLGFSSIFIAFKEVVDWVFTGCRSLVGVNGAHLKANYGGVLLSAVALDANNEIVPFAWGIVAGEDEEAWNFFLWHLKNVLKDGGRGDEWCIISDRQKGIQNVIADLWPKVDRRYCCKHLSKNFKRKFPGPLIPSSFWKACDAYSFFTFEKAMKQLHKANPLSLVWLSKIEEQSTWSKHAFQPRVKSDVNKCNFVESFNATLGIDRCRSVLTLLEGVRRVTMVRMATRRQVCEHWDRDDICPNIINRLQVLSSDSRTCIPYLSGDGEYEVVDDKSMLPAIPDREQWPESSLPAIEPPAFKRGVGRPPKNRRREEEEQRKCKRSNTVKCGICKEFGHNSQTCKGGLTSKEHGKKMKKKGGSSQP